MRTVEIRRHSFTKKGEARGRGSHLSDEGVRAARADGGALGPRFDRVLASTSPRTSETAIAMGFAVDQFEEMPSPVETGEIEFHAWRTWEDPCSTMRQLAHDSRTVAAYLDEQAARLLAALDGVPDGGRALVVGHGGWLESVVAALVPPDAGAALGGSFWHLEGVRLGVGTDGAAVVEAVHRREHRD